MNEQERGNELLAPPEQSLLSKMSSLFHRVWGTPCVDTCKNLNDRLDRVNMKLEDMGSISETQ